MLYYHMKNIFYKFLTKKNIPVWPLVFTSITFLLPTFVFLNHSKESIFYFSYNLSWPLILSISSFLTSCASINNWLDPKPGWKSKSDRFFAIIGFVIYSIRGKIILTENNLHFNYLVWILMVFGYINSRVLRKLKKSYWVWFHVIFHLSVTTGSYFVMFESLKCHSSNIIDE